MPLPLCSIDVRMELEQAGGLQLTALFTFVARDMLSNRPHPVAPLVPKTRLVGNGCSAEGRASLSCQRRAKKAGARLALLAPKPRLVGDGCSAEGGGSVSA